MLPKQRKIPAVVSVLLVTITVTLTLTLTVSATATKLSTITATATAKTTVTAIDERTTVVNTTTTTTSTDETTAVTSKRQQRQPASNETTNAAAETTTTAFLTLQPPPLNVTSPTTTSSYEAESKSKPKSAELKSTTAAPVGAASTPKPKPKNVTAVETSSPSKNSINHKIDKANSVAVKSDKKSREDELVTHTETKADEEKSTLEKQLPKQLIKLLTDELEHSSSSSSPLMPVGFRANADLNTPRPQLISTPKGYINFEPQDPIEMTAKQKQTKTQTVNEVLTSLFPNGFSDIFRFSYATEQTTPVLGIEANSESTSTSTSTTATTTAESTEEASTPKPAPEPTIRYTTSVSKEYRRLVSPGHTEIIVEKLALPSSSEEFSDGSNSISKDELLRINRAAVDAPVLPSLLVEPTQQNETATSAAPIVILKENSAEHDDLMDGIVDDNLIAESQDHVQHVFQRLPAESPKQNYKLNKAPEVNVEIIHDETLRPDHKGIFGQRLFTPAAELPKKELQTKGALSNQPENKPNQAEQPDFQQQVELAYQQPQATAEAPSRKFLKHFNPQLSESASGLVKKGNFHYETIGRQQRVQTSTAKPGDYESLYVKPAAQLQYQRQSKQQLQEQSTKTQTDNQNSLVAGSQPVTTSADYKGYDATPIHEDNQQPADGVVFVTVNTPKTNATPKPTPLPLLPPHLVDKTPHDYVAEAIGAASHTVTQGVQEPKQSAGYTYVEVQKSVNIHNKLITEKDGQLVEQHETIYHQPEYAQDVAVPTSQQAAPLAAKDYVSLSAHPINVQHIDDAEGETHEEAASQTAAHQVHPPAYSHSQPQQQTHYVEKLVPQPYPVPVEKIVDRPYPVTQVVEKPVPAPYPVKEIVEKVVDRPVEVEKVVDRPVKVPYPVHHYIDRPYPVHEIIEQPVAIPYAVPEPVAVPVPVETYIDRPYPVETIVEKHVPYPVEKVVEKVVEKHVPVEVERIVEKPKYVEKVVEKLVDRPIAIPIHVPVAVPVPPYTSHPNALSWSNGASTPPQRYQKIPPKVLQNYYTRMLKKLLDSPNLNLPSQIGHSSVPPVVPVINLSQSTKVTKPTQPTTPIQFTKPPFKISDIRYDLKPPPPPLGPSWSKGARYIYNTLPAGLATALVPDQDFGPQQQILFIGALPQIAQPTGGDASFDEFQRWRNGHSLKRSPDFGRNLHIEYGFKPPLVPSLEIDENGMPLKASAAKSDE